MDEDVRTMTGIFCTIFLDVEDPENPTTSDISCSIPGVATTAGCAASSASLPAPIGSKSSPAHNERTQRRKKERKEQQQLLEEIVSGTFGQDFRLYEQLLLKIPQTVKGTSGCRLPLCICSYELKEIQDQ